MTMFMEKRDIIFLILVFTAVSIYCIFFKAPEAAVDFNYEEGILTLSEPHSGSCSIDLRTATDIRLVEEPDYGEAAEGGTASKNLYGGWHSDSFGDYRAFVTTGIDCCIAIDSAEGTTVFNCSNRETTISLCSELIKYIGEMEDQAK